MHAYTFFFFGPNLHACSCAVRVCTAPSVGLVTSMIASLTCFAGRALAARVPRSLALRGFPPCPPVSSGNILAAYLYGVIYC